MTAESAPGTAKPGAPAGGSADCAVCAALVRQCAEAREDGDERCARECEAELANHRHNP